jgi:hypothetical protein
MNSSPYVVLCVQHERPEMNSSPYVVLCVQHEKRA